MENNKNKTFWLDGFDGMAEGGLYFRAFDLIKFINKIEDSHGKVVGINFDGSNNLEVIFDTNEKKERETKESAEQQSKLN